MMAFVKATQIYDTPVKLNSVDYLNKECFGKNTFTFMTGCFSAILYDCVFYVNSDNILQNLPSELLTCLKL